SARRRRLGPGRLRIPGLGLGALVRGIVQRRVHALDGLQRLALAQADQGHALGVATDLRDLRGTGAHQGAAVGDQQDLVLLGQLDRADQAAVALAGLDRDHTLGAATLLRVLRQRGALAVAALGGGEDVALAV